MPIRKSLLIVLTAVFLFQCIQQASGQDKFPLHIQHSSCASLLTRAEEIKKENFRDFIEQGSIKLNLVDLEATIKPGSVYDDLNLIVINSIEFQVLSNDKALLSAYNHHIKNIIKNLDEKIFERNGQMIISTLTGSRDIISFFHFLDNRILVYTHLLDFKDKLYNAKVFNAIRNEIKYANELNHSIVWIGDDTKYPVNKILNEERSYCFRRVSSIDKPIPYVSELLRQEYNPQSSTICNSIPTTPRQLAKGGLPTNRLSEWVNFKDEIKSATTGRFAKEITSIAELKDEMVNGEADLVMVVAHLQGSHLFVGNESLDLNQIKDWAARESPTGGKRTAILSICNAGNQQYYKGSLFWKEKIEPLSNTLIQKGYFDLVIAPDHTIYREEAVSVVRGLLTKRPMSEIQSVFQGWWPYVKIFSPKISIL